MFDFITVIGSSVEVGFTHFGKNVVEVRRALSVHKSRTKILCVGKNLMKIIFGNINYENAASNYMCLINFINLKV